MTGEFDIQKNGLPLNRKETGEKLLAKIKLGADFAEGALTTACEIFPTLPGIRKEYLGIVRELEDPEVKEYLEKPDTALIVNLAAASWSLNTTPKKMNARGVLSPAMLFYAAVADLWDDEFDSLEPDSGVDPYKVFKTGKGQKAFNKGVSALETVGLGYYAPFFADSTNDYIKAEAILAKCNGEEKLSSREVLEKIVKLRNQSFGQMAEALTLLMAHGSGLSVSEKDRAAEQMRYFALLGGLVDGWKDRKKDKGRVVCADNFEGQDLLKEIARTYGKILDNSSWK